MEQWEKSQTRLKPWKASFLSMAHWLLASDVSRTRRGKTRTSLSDDRKSRRKTAKERAERKRPERRKVCFFTSYSCSSHELASRLAPALQGCFEANKEYRKLTQTQPQSIIGLASLCHPLCVTVSLCSMTLGPQAARGTVHTARTGPHGSRGGCLLHPRTETLTPDPETCSIHSILI